MTNFTVVSNHGSYRATSHEFKLVFLHRSTVIPVGEDVILKTCFNMFPFSELLNMTQDYDFLVGLLTSVGEAKEYAKEEKIGKIIVLELTSKKCDHPLDWPMYLWKTNLGGLTTISLLVFSRFKIKITLEDHRGEGIFVLFDREASYLSKKSCADLFIEVQKDASEVFFEVLDASSHHREKVIHKDHVVTFKEKMNLSL
ncbi:uncharacterized protein LOC130968336 isoform X2 [Arachis stenosperma]|uniref:uncharacterized protein LOC130968336 isoform X2 n=1 Tax=Arachis stenosperma TaxID=217475 RepID=UPI0025AD4FB4|nr:uncharacterized protein LOC130968336 isoform X2 [Arachis stenosperma]